jgi:prepilin-type N-terminal cleavage/methylation domain-containing protein
MSIYWKSRKAFTLIELLVVIAIIAILAVVVILTLNPVELLRQSRDSNRVSDMSTLSSALGLYSEDQSSATNFSLGSSSIVYVSIPDPSATSTSGTNCASLGLPTLPSSYFYHCAASSTYRNVNGTGWIPVNLSNISTGSPLGSLPVDPANNSSSRLYYTYDTNGTTYEVTSVMESQKYGVGGSNDVISSDGGPLASVYEKGSKLGLEPLDYGDNTLVGWWPLTEGTGTVAYDDSGNNATGSWSGTQIGSNGYYTTAAKVGSYAGDFDGSPDLVDINPSTLSSVNNFTVSMWYECQNTGSQNYIVLYLGGGNRVEMGLNTNQSYGYTNFSNTNYQASGPGSCNSSWNFLAFTRSGSVLTVYLNGGQRAAATDTGASLSDSTLSIGSEAPYGPPGNYNFLGAMNDIRLYNRALSPTQIASMYNGGK